MAGDFYSRLFCARRQRGRDQLYRDFSGDDVTTETDDRRAIGNAQPKFLGGVTNSFAYKGVELNVFFRVHNGVYPYSKSFAGGLNVTF